jgi:hypothetical protein
VGSRGRAQRAGGCSSFRLSASGFRGALEFGLGQGGHRGDGGGLRWARPQQSRARRVGRALHGLAGARLVFHGLAPHGNRYWRPLGANEDCERFLPVEGLRHGAFLGEAPYGLGSVSLREADLPRAARCCWGAASASAARNVPCRPGGMMVCSLLRMGARPGQIAAWIRRAEDRRGRRPLVG